MLSMSETKLGIQRFKVVASARGAPPPLFSSAFLAACKLTTAVSAIQSGGEVARAKLAKSTNEKALGRRSKRRPSSLFDDIPVY